MQRCGNCAGREGTRIGWSDTYESLLRSTPVSLLEPEATSDTPSQALGNKGASIIPQFGLPKTHAISRSALPQKVSVGPARKPHQFPRDPDGGRVRYWLLPRRHSAGLEGSAPFPRGWTRLIMKCGVISDAEWAARGVCPLGQIGSRGRAGRAMPMSSFGPIGESPGMRVMRANLSRPKPREPCHIHTFPFRAQYRRIIRMHRATSWTVEPAPELEEVLGTPRRNRDYEMIPRICTSASSAARGCSSYRRGHASNRESRTNRPAPGQHLQVPLPKAGKMVRECEEREFSSAANAGVWAEPTDEEPLRSSSSRQRETDRPGFAACRSHRTLEMQFTSSGVGGMEHARQMRARTCRAIIWLHSLQLADSPLQRIR
jgi:hypothetical protein